MAEEPRCTAQWDTRELLVLVDSKKFQQDQSQLDSSRDRIRTAEQRWKDIEDMCKANNVQRGWKQCKKRWEKLLTDFKKIYDFQAHTPSGGDGYFEMPRSAKKDRSLPTTFQEDVYEAMVVFVPANRAVNPDPNQYVDSTADAEVTEAVRQSRASMNSQSQPWSNYTNSDIGWGDTNRESPDAVFEDLDSDAEPFDSSYIPPSATRENATPGSQTGHSSRDRSTPSQPTNSPNPSPTSVTGQGDAEPSTTRGWKRKKASERTRDEMHKVTEHFVKAIAEDRMSRREEHNELLTFNNKRHTDILNAQVEASRSARQTGIDVANALAFIGESVRYLADGLRQ